MNTNTRNLWSKILTVVGGIAMVVGAIDPMEGSLLIVPGAGLMALGAYLAQAERRVIAYRVWVFILIAIGVGALWGLSAVGGFGGSSGRSMWWGVLILPYLIGWSMGIWGPGSSRWLLWLGIGVGLWYLTILAFLLKHEARGGTLRLDGTTLFGWLASPGAIIGIIGVLTIGGCIYRLRKRMP